MQMRWKCSWLRRKNPMFDVCFLCVYRFSQPSSLECVWRGLETLREMSCECRLRSLWNLMSNDNVWEWEKAKRESNVSFIRCPIGGFSIWIFRIITQLSFSISFSFYRRSQTKSRNAIAITRRHITSTRTLQPPASHHRSVENIDHPFDLNKWLGQQRHNLQYWWVADESQLERGIERLRQQQHLIELG